MTKRMLIDAAHPEETRVVLLDGNQLEDFDVEVSSRRQLKGNIYLAKVIRVEPSLQAAFVDYGGNRHGFLAFSEIHPDYYQIPVADREELAAEQGDALEEAPAEAEADAAQNGDAGEGDAENGDAENGAEANGGEPVEVLGGDETDEISDTHKPRRAPSAKQYKIQEVIKRRQVMLVQVVKEERGNKGAALTTYLSLAGRYCVLMPNTARGGGISRKITNAADRKTLKTILSSLDVPDGMAVILRTAGIGRTKAEIKRDFEYLIRLWTTIRDMTLQSTAPTLVHEEGDIVRRSIRDHYSRDFDEVLVEGDDAYKAAKEFMKLLIPSHARKVKQYKETDAPLLRSYGVEGQLDAIHNPIVHLPSGGYIVINPTEALVSIDVNSGRATKERSIEETALKTNLEAATEVARQLRLRDLAGLIVIDFIDMEVNRNNAQVERRMKEALKHDRARIQVGRISPFGLLEMSRQRLRPSLIETSSEPCPYCGGTGIRRSTESTALVVLRAIDEEGAQGRASELTVHVPTAVALYILNHKRGALAELEAKHEMQVLMTNDDSLIPPDLRLERTKNADGETISEMVATVRPDIQEEQGRKRRRRRRGGRKRDEDGFETQAPEAQDQDADQDVRGSEAEGEDGEEKKGRRRRRSRRGGRRRRKGQDAQTDTQADTQAEVQGEGADEGVSEDAAQDAAEQPAEAEAKTGDEAEGEEKPKRRRSRRRKKADDGDKGAQAASEAPEAEGTSDDDGGEDKSEDKPQDKPKRTRRRAKKADGEDKSDAKAVAKSEKGDGEDKTEAEDKPKPKRTRSRKKKDDGEAPVETTEAKPAEAPSAEAQPSPGTETVVIGGEAAEDKPKKKGWWSTGA